MRSFFDKQQPSYLFNLMGMTSGLKVLVCLTLWICVSGCLGTRGVIRSNPNKNLNHVAILPPTFEVQEIDINGALAAKISLLSSSDTVNKASYYTYQACEMIKGLVTTNCLDGTAIATSFGIMGLKPGTYQIGIRECRAVECSKPGSRVFVQPEAPNIPLQEAYGKKHLITQNLLKLGPRITEITTAYSASLGTCKDTQIANSLSQKGLETIHQLGPQGLGILLATPDYEIEKLFAALQAQNPPTQVQNAKSTQTWGDKAKLIAFEVCVGGTTFILFGKLKSYAGKFTQIVGAKLKAQSLIKDNLYDHEGKKMKPLFQNTFRALGVLGIIGVGVYFKDEIMQRLSPQKLTQVVIDGVASGVSLDLTDAIPAGCEATAKSVEDMKTAIQDLKKYRTELESVALEIDRLAHDKEKSDQS